MATIGRVVVDVDANTAKFAKRLSSSMRHLDEFGGRAKRLNKTFSLLFAGIGAASVVSFGRSVVNAGNKMEGFERALAVAAGSAAGAAKELQFITELSDEIGVNFEAAASSFSKFSAAAKGSSLAGAQTRDIFTSVSKAARVLNLSAADTKGVFRALEQIMSKGQVQAEELRGQLGERLPGAFGLAAKALGVTSQELDKLLRLGKVTAEDLLPKLARELENLFGSQVAAASQSAASNIERFNNALFASKVAAAEGLLPAVSLITKAFADGLPKVNAFFEGIAIGIGGLNSMVDRALGEERGDRIIAAADAFKKSKMELLGLQDAANFRSDIALAIQEDIASKQIEVNNLYDVWQRLVKNAAQRHRDFVKNNSLEKLNEIVVTSTRRASDYGDQLKKLRERFATAEEKAAKLRFTLKLFGDDLSSGQATGIQNEIDRILFSGLDEIAVTSKKRFAQPMKDQMTEIEEAARQAARNIQDAFAEFLFDPFAGGLKGMVEGFATAIRRMLANQAAASLFNGIKNSQGGLLGFLGGLFGGGKAGGGQVSSGTTYLVGERGPELFTPGSDGSITPNSKVGGNTVVVNQNYNIAAGADWETLQKVLPPLFEQNRLATIGELKQLESEGAL